MVRMVIMLLLASMVLPLSSLRAQENIEVEDIKPEDVTTSDFGLEDIEELPLPTDEEFGVQIEGEQYIPTPAYPQNNQQVADEVELEEVPTIPAPQQAPPAAPQVAQPEPQPAQNETAEPMVEPEPAPMQAETAPGEPMVEPMAEPVEDMQVPADTMAEETMSAPADTTVAAIPPQVTSSGALPSRGVVRLSPPGGPEVHEILTGDTLWDVCSRFFGDPYLWPKLWAMNQYITNPHFIFPGDQLRFYMGTATSAPKLEIMTQGMEGGTEVAGAESTEELTPLDDAQVAEVAGAESGSEEMAVEPMAQAEPISTDPTSMSLEEKGGVPQGAIQAKNYSFLSDKQIKAAGKITHSGVEKYILSTGDRVYLSFKNDVNVGDRFLIVEKVRKIAHPKKSFGNLGYLVEIKGQVRVTDMKNEATVGFIEDSWRISSKGDLLIPYETLIKQVIPQEATVDLTGTVIESGTGQYMIGQRDLLFIDLGAKQGLKQGDKLTVVRRGDGVFDDGRKLPYVSVAELTTLEVMEQYAVAYVNWTRKSIEVGDSVKTRFQ